MGEAMVDAAVDRPNWKGLADAVVVVVKEVEPPSMLALDSAGLPNVKTDEASESVLTTPPKENDADCLVVSSVVFAATPKANVGSFLSTAVVDAPKAKVVAGFDGSLNVDAAVVVVVVFGKLEPNENTDDAGAAVVVTLTNEAFSSTFLTASPNVKLRVLLPLSLVRPDPNVPIVVLPKVGIFDASSDFGRAGVEVAPKLKTGAGFSDVTASAFFSRELAPKANIAGRGAVDAAVVVVDEVVAG